MNLHGRTALGILALVLVTAIVLSAVVSRERGSVEETLASEHPALFDAPTPPCPGTTHAAKLAARSEVQGHYLSDRYPYDPQDGIEAIEQFQQAQSCYAISGVPRRAKIVQRLAADLKARINIDYASSRLVLASALESESWTVALNEIQRLLQLTEHVQNHAYVEYLFSIVGEVTIRASAES